MLGLLEDLGLEYQELSAAPDLPCGIGAHGHAAARGASAVMPAERIEIGWQVSGAGSLIRPHAA